MKLLYIFFGCIFFGIFYKASGISKESNGQVIRGKVVDKLSQVPLPGANVVLLDSNPLVVTSTNENGEFRILNVPFGQIGRASCWETV